MIANKSYQIIIDYSWKGNPEYDKILLVSQSSINATKEALDKLIEKLGGCPEEIYDISVRPMDVIE